MKKTLLILVFLCFFISCKKTDSIYKTVEVANAKPADSILNRVDRFSFNDFICKVSTSDTKSKIDFSSNAKAKDYRAIISEQYDSKKINFAGHYIVTTWGCGKICINGAIVDTRDGKIYSLPKNDFWEGIGNKADYESNSYLLITSAIQLAQDEKGNLIDLHNYWKWNEQQKKFEDLGK